MSSAAAKNTDDHFSSEEVAELKKRAAEMENRIEDLLEKSDNESYMKVCEIITDPSISDYIKCSKKLSNLCILSVCERKQIEKGMKTTLFSGRTLEDLEVLYQEIVFRLRRIEFGKEIDIKRDILGFLQGNNLSLDVLVSVLYGTAYLYDKDGIWNKIAGESESE